MEAIDYDVNVFNQQGREADKHLAVRFYVAPIRNEGRSVNEGRPIYEDTEMVEIRVRGDRNNVVQRPVRLEDKQRFRDQYRAYKDDAKQLESGTPLAQWPIMSASMVEELRYLGFHTVEQVANAQDNVIAKMAGLGTYKQKAKLYMEQAAGGAPIEKLAKENQELKDQLEVSSRTVSDLSEKLEKLTAKFTDLAEKVASKK